MGSTKSESIRLFPAINSLASKKKTKKLLESNAFPCLIRQGRSKWTGFYRARSEYMLSLLANPIRL